MHKPTTNWWPEFKTWMTALRSKQFNNFILSLTYKEGFHKPGQWINGNTTLSNVRYRLIQNMKAKVMRVPDWEHNDIQTKTTK